MTPCYYIVGWNDTYEKAQNRKAKTFHWVSIPIKHDGAGFRRISIQPNATDLFSAWILILQVAAKCPVRGVLADSEGNPLDAEDMAIKTGFPCHIFNDAFEFFCSSKLGWLATNKIENSGSETENNGSDTIINNANTTKSKKSGSGLQKSGSENTHSTVQDNTEHNNNIAQSLPESPTIKELFEAQKSDDHLVWRWLLSRCAQLNEVNFSYETMKAIERCYKNAPLWFSAPRIVEAMSSAVIDNPRRISGYVRTIWSSIDLEESKKVKK